MTRLITDDIDYISNKLYEYDMELKIKYGFTLEDIAVRAVNASPYSVKNLPVKTAVVPITSGIGIIEGFSQTVNDILKHCGSDAFVTEKTDVAGIQEAYLKKADIIFMSDDDVCGAFGLNGQIFSDNGYATGISFAAALEMMMDKVIEEEILILGAGPVGTAAAQYFSGKGAIPVICDLDEEKAHFAARTITNSKVEKSLKNIKKYLYIIDATTSGGFIRVDDVTEHTRISAPGMPIGVTKEAGEKAVVFHNPLELGIMTMYFDCMNKIINLSQERRILK